jgi:hypothetical protein
MLLTQIKMWRKISVHCCHARQIWIIIHCSRPERFRPSSTALAQDKFRASPTALTPKRFKLSSIILSPKNDLDYHPLLSPKTTLHPDRSMPRTAAESRTLASACRNTGMQDHRNECNGCWIQDLGQGLQEHRNETRQIGEHNRQSRQTGHTIDKVKIYAEKKGVYL